MFSCLGSAAVYFLYLQWKFNIWLKKYIKNVDFPTKIDTLKHWSTSLQDTHYQSF